MESDHRIIPKTSSLQNPNNSFTSSSSSSTKYYDALQSLSLDSLPPQKVLDNQLTFLGSGTSKKPNSSFIYGQKPRWGWDYVLSFKMPKFLKDCPSSSGTPSTCTSADIGRVQPGQSAGRETRTLEKDRELVLRRVEILARLKSAGFVISQLMVPSEGVILVRITLPEKRMKEKAVKLGIELRLQPEYGGGYLAFSEDHERMFLNYELAEERNCYFAPADRSIIIMGVLQSKESWGCDLNIEKLLHEGVILQAFALHSEKERWELVRETVWKRVWDPTYLPPFGLMKDYLGARVTFYFVFVRFYARRLLLIAVLSIPVYTVYRLLQNERVIAILRWVFSVGLVLWTTVLLETWKRHNAEVNVEWGLDDYKEDVADDTRPQFVGEIRYGFYCDGGFVSLADLVEDAGHHNDSTAAAEAGEKAIDILDLPKNLYQDPQAARNARLWSLAVTSFFVVVVGSLTFLLLWWRNDVIKYFFTRTGHEGFSNAVPGILNGILITVFDSVWQVVSAVLTRRENHRTNQEYENSLVYKRFAFQFISNYVSLFFIAFVKPYIRPNRCIEGYAGNGADCMVELETQLMSLVITKATIGQITELGVPFVTNKVKQWRSRRRSSKSLKEDEKVHASASSGHNRYVAEAHLGAYTTTIEDYGELVVQFGYLVLFGLAFPPAAIVALANNVIEGRTDAYKILALSQRVNADDAADIGAWYSILEFLNVVSVVANAGLVVFTADAAGVLFGFSAVGQWRGLLYRVVAFFVMEHVLLVVKGVAAFLIADVPGRTRRRKARESYDIARWFNVGWRDAFRGNSLLMVDERQVGLCERYADVFERASEEGDRDGGGKVEMGQVMMR